ncbi:MAG: FAD-dependent oxidoreductase [Planctomycetales bacterium]|nr:FAD-dependent oxidoreductase [Planctomycetales bacterium]
MQDTWDVIVVGGGGSGLAAAVSAASAGLSVLLLEKRPELGGTTGIAVGSFTASGTEYQRRADISDNPDDHEADAALFGPPEVQARNNAAMRRYFLGHAAETLDWLRDLGLNFHGPSPEPPNRAPRMHNVVPNAKAYIAVLQSHLLRLGGEIVCEATVKRLTTFDAAVTGVEVEIAGEGTRELIARSGVVLAAGDYANNSQMINRYKGPQFGAVEGINPYATGDGHRLAEQAGAELVNMDITYGPELRFVPPPRQPFSQLLPSRGTAAKVLGKCLPLVPDWVLSKLIKRLLVTWQHPENSLFDDGAILVNQRGERFCDERRSPEREIAIASQPDKKAYLLLDARLVDRYSRWPHFISTAPEIAYAYVDDYRRLRPDVTTTGDKLSDLASQRDIPMGALERAVSEYHSSESVPKRTREEKSPWVLLGPVKSYFTTTEGGAKINQQMQVLNSTGQPIPGLFAVGQNGLSGMVLWGHGLHIAWALTSGRLAGLELARQATGST